MGTNCNTESELPSCTVCENPAVVRSVYVSNEKIKHSQPLCKEHYTPPQNMTFPSSTEQESVIKKAKTKFGVITTPADDVWCQQDSVIIVHGPGDQTEITTPRQPDPTEKEQ